MITKDELEQLQQSLARKCTELEQQRRTTQTQRTSLQQQVHKQNSDIRERDSIISSLRRVAEEKQEALHALESRTRDAQQSGAQLLATRQALATTQQQLMDAQLQAQQSVHMRRLSTPESLSCDTDSLCLFVCFPLSLQLRGRLFSPCPRARRAPCERVRELTGARSCPSGDARCFRGAQNRVATCTPTRRLNAGAIEQHRIGILQSHDGCQCMAGSRRCSRTTRKRRRTQCQASSERTTVARPWQRRECAAHCCQRALGASVSRICRTWLAAHSRLHASHAPRSARALHRQHAISV